MAAPDGTKAFRCVCAKCGVEVEIFILPSSIPKVLGFGVSFTCGGCGTKCSWNDLFGGAPPASPQTKAPDSAPYKSAESTTDSVDDLDNYELDD